MRLHKRKLLILFLGLFLHVLVFNLFYVTPNGAVFYWQENFNLHALSVYLLTALMSIASYLVITLTRTKLRATKVQIGDKVWLYSSLLIIPFICYLTL